MESIFNTIYTLCADNEKYYIQNKDKFWFKLLGYKNIKKNYKGIYDVIAQIETISDTESLQILFADFIDTLATSSMKTIHCKSVDSNDQYKKATIEYSVVPNLKSIVICIKDINNNINCKFHILEKDKEILSFDINFNMVGYVSQNENLAESSYSEAALRTQNRLLEVIKEDMICYLNSFVSDSEGRIGLDGKKDNKDKRK